MTCWPRKASRGSSMLGAWGADKAISEGMLASAGSQHPEQRQASETICSNMLAGAGTCMLCPCHITALPCT